MHQEKILHRLGHWQENISVEMRSIGGYSGSPVTIYIAPFALRPNDDTMRPEIRQWLLGVDWGHVPHRELVLTSSGERHPDGLYINTKCRTSVAITGFAKYSKFIL